MIAASLTLYQTTLDAGYLDFAILLAEGARKLFYDAKNGGFYVGTDRPDLVLRLKDDFDGATPTASSQAAYQFLRLAVITGREDFRKIGEKTLHGASASIKASPFSFTEMMSVAEMELGEQPKLVIAGKETSSDFIKARFQTYRPHLLLTGNEGKVDAFALTLKPKDAKPPPTTVLGKHVRHPSRKFRHWARCLGKRPPDGLRCQSC